MFDSPAVARDLVCNLQRAFGRVNAEEELRKRLPPAAARRPSAKFGASAERRGGNRIQGVKSRRRATVAPGFP
jgi:hypothetical protein